MAGFNLGVVPMVMALDPGAWSSHANLADLFRSLHVRSIHINLMGDFAYNDPCFVGLVRTGHNRNILSFFFFWGGGGSSWKVKTLACINRVVFLK